MHNFLKKEWEKGGGEIKTRKIGKDNRKGLKSEEGQEGRIKKGKLGRRRITGNG